MTLTALLLAIPLLLTGCTHKAKAPKPGDPKTETLTVWRQPINKKADDKIFEKLIVDFETAYPTVDVVYRSFGPDEDYETAVLNALASDNRPDVFEIRNDELARHLSKLAPYPGVENLKVENFKKNYASNIAEEMISDGKLYGMPLGIDPLVLYINEDHLKEAKIEEMPKTWDDLIQLAVILTRKVDNIIFRPGLAMGTASNVDRAGEIVELLMLQLGTQMVDSAGRTATFNLYTTVNEDGGFSYPGRNALEFYAAFAKPESGFQTWDINQPYSTQAFASGNLSMMINYYSIGGQLQEINPKLKFATVALPQRLSIRFPYRDSPGGVEDPVYTSRYRAMVASKPWERLSSKQQDIQHRLAWKFIDFNQDDSVIEPLTNDAWLISPRRQTKDSENNNDAMLENMQTWFRGNSPRAVDGVMHEMVKAVTENNASIEQMVDQAAKYITTILK